MFTSREYSILECPPIRPLAMDTTTPKWKCNNIELAPSCPRCASSNTKFCYYNNYSLSQPRYFCKGCRRYWTKGGSLRNVPVGGGCRKSRRSRATKQGGPGNHAAPTLSSISAGSPNESESGTDIDMAAVFAKYLNQDLENEESSTPGVSSGSSDNVQASSFDSQMEDITMFEYQTPLDLINGAGTDQIQQVVPQFSMHDEVNGQDFVYQDCNGLELQQGILGDEIASDVLWSDGADLPDIGSQQPMVQVDQDSGLFSPDYQLRIFPNLETDNWGSFDLSAYELFSRP